MGGNLAGAGAKVAVLGAGPIGLSVLAALKAAGAAAVYVTDIRRNRAEAARKLGADWIGVFGDSHKQDVVAEILAAQPLGVDIVYECAGEQETVDQALELLAPGGMLMLVGIPAIDRLSFEMNAMRRKEIRIQNVRRQSHCVEAAIDMLAGGKVNLDAMVTHHFTMEQVQQAFDTVANYRDNVIKAMLHVSA
jgi:threonine dehydrogenase-like Zn-dependent dehydrogenase